MNEFTPKQLKAIALLASGSTINQAAASIGVGEKTIDTWLRDSSFKGEVREQSQKIFDAAMAKAVATLNETITGLIEIRDNAVSDRDKIAASKILLDCAYKWHENQLEQRILDIEEQLKINE